MTIQDLIEQQLELVQTGAVSEQQAAATVLGRHSLSEILSSGSVPFLEILVKDKTVASEILGNPEFEPQVLRALNAKDQRLPHVALTALETTGQFRPEMVRLLTAESTGVSDRAAKLLARFMDAEVLAQVDPSLQLLFRDSSEVVQVRILALLIDAGRAKPELLKDLAARGYVEKILATFLTDDLLLKLNGAALVEALGSFPEGGTLLKQDPRIIAAIAEELEHPLDDTTENSVLLLVANLGLVDSELFWRKIGNFFSQISDRVLFALKAVAAVARHPEGRVREAVKTREADLKEKLVKSLNSTNVEIVKAALDAWSALVLLWSRDSVTEAAKIADKIFDAKPFPDVRALNWALFTTLLSIGNFVDSQSAVLRLLKDFTSEEDYDARRAKWDFVRVFVTKKDCKALVDDETWKSLIAYAQQGLAYAPVRLKEPGVEQMVG